LELPPQLSDVHDVFHVSRLKKYLRVPKEQIPMEDLDAKDDLSYQEYPIKILEMFERVMQNKRIKMCKVQQSHHTEEEATWEREEELKAEFLSFFSDPSESRG
jgi:UTP:GlnB (protein PII) uridylyltransferase